MTHKEQKRSDQPDAERRRAYKKPQLEVVIVELDEVVAMGCKIMGEICDANLLLGS
jgi:hypothetical protein